MCIYICIYIYIGTFVTHIYIYVHYTEGARFNATTHKLNTLTTDCIFTDIHIYTLDRFADICNVTQLYIAAFKHRLFADNIYAGDSLQD